MGFRPLLHHGSSQIIDLGIHIEVAGHLKGSIHRKKGAVRFLESCGIGDTVLRRIQLLQSGKEALHLIGIAHIIAGLRINVIASVLVRDHHGHRKLRRYGIGLSLSEIIGNSALRSRRKHCRACLQGKCLRQKKQADHHTESNS